jgi:hypothetical protein
MQFNLATFKATHNSHSGESRGSILDQLESGVRCIELDEPRRQHGHLHRHARQGHRRLVDPRNLSVDMKFPAVGSAETRPSLSWDQKRLYYGADGQVYTSTRAQTN